MTDADPELTDADRELLLLVQTRTPEELTADEIARLRSALHQSTALQQALSDRLEIEQYLNAALGSHQLSAEQVFAAAVNVPPSPGRRLVSLLGVVVCLVLVGFLVSVLWLAMRGPHDQSDRGQAVVASATGAQSAPPASGPAEAPPAGPAPAAAASGPTALEQPAGGNGEKAGESTAAPPGNASKSEPSQPPAAAPANASAAQTGQEPWTATDVLAAQPAPTGAEALDDFSARTTAPEEAELRRWFTEVPRQRGTIGSIKAGNATAVLFEGLWRLRSPWAPRVALRMTVHERPKLAMHFFRGDRALTVRPYEHQYAWVAYEGRRKPGSPIPELERLVAHDDELSVRANPVDPSTYDLSFDGRLFTLSRGNLPLMRAPFDGMPSEVYFDGKAVLRQLELVRAVELPDSPPPGPVVNDLRQPASSEWTFNPQENASLSKLPDGRVELQAAKSLKIPVAAMPLAFDRVQEVILQLDEVSPGTGIFWGNPLGKPVGGVQFVQDKKTHNLVLQITKPPGATLEIHADPDHGPVSFCGAQVWVKILSGAATMRCWISADGEHWARACEPWMQVHESLGTIGLFCIQDKQPHGIKLRRIAVRELPGINSLVPAELRPKIPQLSGRPDLASWLEGVYASQPGNVETTAWRMACAARSLAADFDNPPRHQLLFKLLEDVLASERPWQQRLRVLNEAALLCPCFEDTWAGHRLLGQYAQFAGQLASEGKADALAEVARAQSLAPLWLRSPVGWSEEAFRSPILQLTFAQRWPELYDFCSQVRFTRRNVVHQPGVLDWAEAYSARQVPQRAAAGSALLRGDWRHPLITELSKEGFNLLAELEAALDGKSYQEACQIVSTAGNQASSGLLPDSHDPDLLISLASAVDRAMQDHPALRTTMNEQYGPVGRLRIRQAIAEEDVAAVEAGALQFTGTEAAAEAHLWLGDRAQARGAFAQALAHYHEALRSVAPSERGRVMAGAQLAAAMMGQPLPGETVGAAEFGEVHLAPAEFTRLLGEMRSRHSSANLADPSTTRPAAVDMSPTAQLTPRVRGRFDGDVGNAPDKVPGDVPQQHIDWVARQTSVVTAGQRLIISNRFQVSAFDSEHGNFAWRTGLGGEAAETHDWSLTPMRPLVTAKAIFVRRLPKAGPELAALDVANGKVLWTSAKTPNKFVLSDPLLVQEELFAVTAAWSDQELQLSLTAFDAQSGNIVHEHPLVLLREGWWQDQLRSCQVAALADTVVVACGGSVLRADLMGNVRWLRRETWVPPRVDRGWISQEPSPPIESNGRLLVTQPGVYAVSAIASETGRLAWRQPVPGLRRLLGLDGSRVIVQTDAGFAALDVADGKVLWETSAPDALDGVLLAASGELISARRHALLEDKNKASCPLLVKIDTETGRETAAWLLDNLQHEQPRLGPLVVVGDRLWTLFGRGEKDAYRDILELAVKPAAEQPAGGAFPRTPLLPDSASDRRWLPQVDPELEDPAATVLPRWRLLGGNHQQQDVHRLNDWQGEQNVLELTPSGTPLRLVRRVRLPADKPAVLRLLVASDAKWRLHVDAAGKTLFDEAVQPVQGVKPWRTLDVDLAPVAGQTVWLVLRQSEEPGAKGRVRWKSANVEEK